MPLVYEGLFPVRDDGGEVRRRLAYWIEAFRRGNQPSIDRLVLAFRLASLFLLIELVLLALGLAID